MGRGALIMVALTALGSCFQSGQALWSDAGADGRPDADQADVDADQADVDADEADGGERDCGPGWCAGCCSGRECLPGTADGVCGTAGDRCEACPEGERCLNGTCSGCTAASCPDGCCSGASCHLPSLELCGVAGGGCRACDADRSDTCSAAGECLCGSGRSCDPGLLCDGGECRCDTATCDGCCSGASCLSGIEAFACGLGGEVCVECEPSEICVAGVCLGCHAETCPDGCCLGGLCHTSSFLSCGQAGESCQVCDPTAADACSDEGRCTCAGDPACDSGQICTALGCL